MTFNNETNSNDATLLNNKILMTREGLENSKIELKELVNVTRNEVIREIQEARAQGDLSENADYDSARNRQAQVESRIKELENRIEKAEIIDQKHIGNTVKIGAVVTLENMTTKKSKEYTIVGSVEANPFDNKISNEAPLAQAILGASKNDIIVINNVEKPYKVKIISIKSK